MAVHRGSGAESAALVAEGDVEAEGAGGPTEEQGRRAVKVRAVALCSLLLALVAVAVVCRWRSATVAAVTTSSGLKGDLVQEAGKLPSSFDGCWQAQQVYWEGGSVKNVSQEIKNQQVYWEGGSVTNVSVTQDTLQMTLHGHTYSATLRGSSMHWDHGDVWNRVHDCSDSGDAPDPVSKGPDLRDLEVHRLLNEARMKGWTCSDGTSGPQEKRKSEFDCRIWTASKLHAMDMEARGFFSHHNPEGKDSDARAKKQGYLYNTAENIQYGPLTAREALDGWMSSLGHCKNMQRDARMHATAFESYFSVMNMGDTKVNADRACLPADSDVY